MNLRRRRFDFFEAGMSAGAQHKIVLARELRRAVNNNTGLSVHYQPQVELSTGRVTGFEALMRWTHPTFGNVPPSDFIPIAESSQLICDLGLWILRVLQCENHFGNSLPWMAPKMRSIVSWPA